MSVWANAHCQKLVDFCLVLNLRNSLLMKLCCGSLPYLGIICGCTDTVLCCPIRAHTHTANHSMLYSSVPGIFKKLYFNSHEGCSKKYAFFFIFYLPLLSYTGLHLSLLFKTHYSIHDKYLIKL